MLGSLLLAVGIGLVLFAVPKKSETHSDFLKDDATHLYYPENCLLSAPSARHLPSRLCLRHLTAFLAETAYRIR
ncbi:protein of unknown function [Methylorubrum extorquens]|uniref:Uncharacterized protein n=1 Tax=Methylorubrum extorquens TaxID=408 RepID=A0A2N9AYR9_METEX|nr:protein of unknown function [Methylorubrum extorquens]